MQLDVKFEESNQRINIPFTEVQTASDGGFERGYEQCKEEMEVYLDDINEAINEKLENEEQYEPSEMGDAIRGIVDHGTWWLDMVASKTSLKQFFAGTNIKETPAELDTSKVTDMVEMFARCSELVTIRTLDTSNCTSITHLCKSCTLLESIPELDLQKCVSIQESFLGCKSIKIIKLLNANKITNLNWAFQNCYAETITYLDLSNVASMSSTFSGCNKLVTIEFAPSSIKCNISFSNSYLLSNESIQSIIDGLADLTGQTSRKVTFHSRVVDRLTDEQWQQIFDKNWEVG